jgi:hypothetical protein
VYRMHLPLSRSHYQCAEKDKETLKETPGIAPLSAAGLTEKQCRANKIAPRSLKALVR